ncbi:MAG: cytochrome P450 [Sphingomonadales bacterium]|nr:cytochrome P450 [Sphingomonadales bacterium]
MPDSARQCPFTPPFPPPLKSKAGLLKRFTTGWKSWIHTLFEKSYRMKMGSFKVPTETFFVVNELSLVAKVMDDEHKEFPKHRLMNDMLDPLLGRSVFSTNGKLWEDQREMINPAFMHTNLKRAFPAMDASAADLVALLGAQDLSKPVDIDPLMTHVTADVIFRTMFGMTLSQQESARVYEAFNRYQKHVQPAMILQLYKLPSFGRRAKMKAAAADVHALFAPILAARLELLEAGGEKPRDILQALIDARHPETGEPFSRQDLLDQLSIIFLAGHETSASALGWTFYLLSECPEWQDRLLAEIEEATGGGEITFEHLKRLEGVRNLFKEGLRLYPPVSFFLREVTRPQQMRGKSMSPGDVVIVSPWLIQRNADNWTCPHSFDPDRFADKANADAARNAWLPFGRGPRICVGAGFAQQEAMLILARVIRAFRLAHPQGRRPEVVSRLTLRPRHGIPLLVMPRR